MNFERTCFVCRSKNSKNNLLRIVKNKQGEIFFDEKQNLEGRGYYVCNNDKCLSKIFEKKLLSKVLRRNVDESVYRELNASFYRTKKED